MEYRLVFADRMNQMIQRREVRLHGTPEHHFLQHLNYGEAMSCPDLPPDEIIPAMLHQPPMSGPWGSRRNLRAQAAYLQPYRVPDTALPQGSAPSEAIVTDVPDEDEADLDFATGEVIDVLIDHPTRKLPRPITDLDPEGLTDEEQQVIFQWFSGAIGRPNLSYHDQVVEISGRLRNLPNKATFERIGKVFGLTKGAISAHVQGVDWSGAAVGRPPVMQAEQVSLIISYVHEETTFHRMMIFSLIFTKQSA
jgi:hypothetical protein